MKHILSLEDFLISESYLKGSRQPLYHNTKNIIGVIESDMLRNRKPAEGYGEEQTISFTRNYQFSEYGYEKLVFDSDKLKNAGYTIYPVDEIGIANSKWKSDKITNKWNYNFRPPKHNIDSITKKSILEIEYEERCNEPITNLGKYLISIDLVYHSVLIKNLKKFIDYLKKYPNIVINIYDQITFRTTKTYSLIDLISLLNKNVNEAKNIISFPNIPNTLNFWHGGNLDDDNYQDNISHKKGRFEYGAGLYLTDSYEVVQKYAKGNRKLYLITVEKGNEIGDCTLPTSKVLKFIERYVIKNKKYLLMERLSRFLDNGESEIKADIFNNMILNTTSIKPSDTENLRSFLIENGVDYELTSNIGGWGGQMMILYNMDKIVNVIKRTPKDEIESYDIKNNYIKESGLVIS